MRKVCCFWSFLFAYCCFVYKLLLLLTFIKHYFENTLSRELKFATTHHCQNKKDTQQAINYAKNNIIRLLLCNLTLTALHRSCAAKQSPSCAQTTFTYIVHVFCAQTLFLI